MLQKFDSSPEAASRAKKSCVKAPHLRRNISRRITSRLDCAIFQGTPFSLSFVCRRARLITLFSRLNRTNLVARRFCLSIVLDLHIRTWIATSLRSIHTFIHIHSKKKKIKSLRPTRIHTFLHFVSDEFVWNSRD